MEIRFQKVIKFFSIKGIKNVPLITQFFVVPFQCRSELDNWGGGLIFIYSCSALLISLEIDCFYGL
jgi:hypothetical protein